MNTKNNINKHFKNFRDSFFETMGGYFYHRGGIARWWNDRHLKSEGINSWSSVVPANIAWHYFWFWVVYPNHILVKNLCELQHEMKRIKEDIYADFEKVGSTVGDAIESMIRRLFRTTSSGLENEIICSDYSILNQTKLNSQHCAKGVAAE